MTERKWTPGPWIIWRDEIGTEETCVVEMSAINSDYDAHLIAAAPDLYEALERLMCLDKYDSISEWKETVQKILAKARGEL